MLGLHRRITAYISLLVLVFAQGATPLVAASPSITASPLPPEACPAGTLFGQNVVTNGDFSAGATGFTSDLTNGGDNKYASDGTFSIQTGSVSYLNNLIGEVPFGGDTLFGIAATQTWMFTNTPTRGPTIWRQQVPVLPESTYTFLMYANNLIRTNSGEFDPIIQLRVDGTNLGGPVIILEEPDQWVRIARSFKTAPGQTSVEVSIAQLSSEIIGNDLGITAINVRQKCLLPLTIEMSSSQQPNTDGSTTISYTATVKNNSDKPITNLKIVDDLAKALAQAGSFTVVDRRSGTLPVNPNFNGRADKNLLLEGATLSGKTTASIAFDVVVTPGAGGQGFGPFLNRTTALFTFDAIPVTVTSEPVSVTLRSIMQARKVVIDLNGGSVQPNDALEYIIDIENVGTAAATGVIFSDAIPSNTTYAPNSTRLNGIQVADNDDGSMPFTPGGREVHNPGAPEGEISGSSTARVSFRVVVNTPSGQVSNQGVINSDGHANLLTDDPTTPGALDSTVALVGDLPNIQAAKVVKDINSGTVEPGDILEYTITVNNTGTAATLGATLTDAIPSYTTYVPGTTTLNGVQVPDSSGAMPFGSGGPINSLGAAAGQINVNTSAVVTFQVKVISPFPILATVVTNHAIISGTNFVGRLTDDPTKEGYGDPTVRNVIGTPDLTLDVTADVKVVPFSGSIVYTLTYKNIGSQGATGVALVETVPNNTTFNPAKSTPGWVCPSNPVGGSVCTFTVSDPVFSQEAKVTFAVDITTTLPIHGKPMENTALIISDGFEGNDPTPNNNISTHVTPLGRTYMPLMQTIPRGR